MVAFLFGNNAHHQEDLLPVLKRHNHEIHIIQGIKKIRKYIRLQLPVLIFILQLDRACQNFCREIRKSGISDYVTIIAFLDDISNENILKIIDLGLDELIVKPREKNELETHIIFAENRAVEKLNKFKYQQEIKESNIKQKSIVKLGMAALSITSLEDLIDKTVNELVNVMRVKYSEFLELQSDDNTFLLRGGVGWKKELIGAYKFDVSDNIQSGFTIHTGKPVVVYDYSKEDRFTKSDLLKGHHIKSGISVAIPGVHFRHSILGIFSDKTEQFTEDDIHYVEAVSNLLSQAMERFEIQQSLKESEERFVGALKESPVALFIQDKDLRYKWVFNPQFGFTKDMALDKTDYDILPENEAVNVTEIKRKVLKSRQPDHREMWLTLNDKRYCFDVTVLPLQNSSGEVVGITASTIDITEIKKTEQALRESENRFHSSFSNAPIGMAIIAPDGHLLEVNEALCKILGYDEDELLTMTFKDLDHPKDTSREIEYIREMLSGEINTYQIEKRYIHKTGKIIWALLSSSVVRDESGSIRYFMGQILDITQRKEFEMQLKKSEFRFSKAFNSAPNPMAISRMRDGYIYDANESFLRFSGYSRDEVIGTTALDLQLWENRKKRQALIKKIAKRGFIYDYGMQFRIKSGNRRDTLLSIEIIELEGEKCLLSMISDITEQKIAEQKLRESEARYRVIFETTVDAIITFDESGIIKTFNHSASQMFGYSHDEVLGKDIKTLLPSLIGKQNHQLIKGDNQGPEVGGVMEMIGYRKDGSTFSLDLSMSKVSLQDRNIFTVIIRDITERRTLEQEILQISELERRRIGQDLHDGLGQMLSGISLISQSLARKLKANALPGSDEVQEIADLIKESDQYAKKLARGLVPVDLEANGITIAIEKLSLNAEKLFGIECQFEKYGTILVEDELMALHLYRIAQEAISNAVKHGKANKIIITISERNECIILSVKDNGLGFREQREKDTGMGLRIMKYRARMIKGTLDIKSDPENATEIICTVPITTDTSAR